MSKAKPKYWITRTYGNRISFRALDSFEVRNPGMFLISHQKHETWAEAYSHILAQRTADVAKLKHQLKLAEAQLVEAKAMQPPADAA